jgi:hyaluronoglucosaminidase
VIEGFYGPPWSHDARLELIEFVAAWQMNAYVYAPKSDPRHRDRWREPYEAHEAARLGALAARCASVGVRFGFAISPGLDVDYANPADRAALVAKLSPLLAGGVDWVMLALDDIPNRVGLAAEQADLVSWLAEQIGGARLTLVPTEYVGVRPSPYLADLASGLPPDVDVMWTGPTVCSPRIDEDDARAWRAAVGDRPLIVWDNYPVNDAVMEPELHLGPYRGRSVGVTDVVDGVLCNPMIQPRASKVALATAAAFLADPANYDEQEAWVRAIEATAGDRADALGVLARACADGPLLDAKQLPLRRLVDEFVHVVGEPDWPEGTLPLRDELRGLQRVEAAYADADDPLAKELAPWLTQAKREADAGLAALRLVQAVRPVATRGDDGAGRAAGPDAESAMIHAFALLFAWSGAQRGDAVVGGPRFALHPAVVQLPDGRPALDVRLAVRENASAIDHLCRRALEQYRQWTEDPVSDVHARCHLEPLPIDADGTFRADPAYPVLLSCGGLTTRVRVSSAPPFNDARLT